MCNRNHWINSELKLCFGVPVDVSSTYSRDWITLKIWCAILVSLPSFCFLLMLCMLLFLLVKIDRTKCHGILTGTIFLCFFMLLSRFLELFLSEISWLYLWWFKFLNFLDVGFLNDPPFPAFCNISSLFYKFDLCTQLFSCASLFFFF